MTTNPEHHSIEPTTVEKLRGLPWSIASNAANALFSQFTFFGSAFILFLSALNLSKSEIGFLLSLLPFGGLLSLFVATFAARFGYKRTYTTFWGARTVVTIFLLFTPWVVVQFGSQAALWFVGVIVALFAIFRAIGITAYFPWVQEYVPNGVRGKYTATNNVFTTLAGLASVAIAGYVLGLFTGLTGFMLLIGMGIVFGFASVALALRIAGGAPAREGDPDAAANHDWRMALGDSLFLRYMTSVSLLTLATVPLASFVPLFMHEQIGLSEASVVWLQTGTLLGSMISSYLWGWAADRYGSRPVTLMGVGMRILLPLLFMLMPRNVPISLYVALAISFVQGVADMGWGIGSARMLYVSVVPTAHRRDYMALYSAWIGIVGGISQLAGGQIVDLAQGLQGTYFGIPVDPYTPLFLGTLLLSIACVVILRTVHADQKVSMSEFAGIFLRGNPFLAMSSVIRYHLAKDEEATVQITERLGRSRSPLTVDELLEALRDPRFNVRFEAVLAIARMEPDARQTKALVAILHGSNPALSVVAAWALGRMGDAAALEPLRDGLDAPYRSIQAHCARSLGTLGDQTSVATLLGRMRQERSDPGLRVAFASALGKMQVTEAIDDLLEFLAESSDESLRAEITLALARIMGDEGHFIHLYRQVQEDAGTTLSQAVSALKKALLHGQLLSPQTEGLLDRCADALARADLTQGAARLEELVQAILSRERVAASARAILAGCANGLDAFAASRLEYSILCVHTLYVITRQGLYQAPGQEEYARLDVMG